MGSCLSLQDSDDERRVDIRRNERDIRFIQNQPIVINNAVCVQHIYRASTESSVPPVSVQKAYYGEYLCQHCGRRWKSTLSWLNAYQRCKKCLNNVYPKNQREVRPSDLKREGNAPEHSRQLCQKCQQLGHYCGKVNDFAKSQTFYNRTGNNRDNRPRPHNYKRPIRY